MTTMVPAAYSRASGAAFTENDVCPCIESSSVALTQAQERKYRLVIDKAPFPPWISPTIAALHEIQNLPEGWDSYGSPAIEVPLILRALETLLAVMSENSPAPGIVPLSDGGIQLEWHRRRRDLELVFPVGGAAEFFYRNNETGQEEEGAISASHELVAKFLTTLA